MLILGQERKSYSGALEMKPYLLWTGALALSLPFAMLSAHYLESAFLGFFLGAALFAYTLLMARFLKKQPPLFLKRFLKRREDSLRLSVNEESGLLIDFVGGRDPQDSIDGIVHNRAGELQRIVRCLLPPRYSVGRLSLLMEILCADLARFSNARFQIVFPEATKGRREEIFLIVSHTLSGVPQTDELPPLAQMQAILDLVIERLITLGMAPSVLGSVAVRQIVSEELGGSRASLTAYWRSMGNLGWEPSFRDIDLKSCERFIQIGGRRSSTISVDCLPESNSFDWLTGALADLPDARVSIFISSWTEGGLLGKNRLGQKLKRLVPGASPEKDGATAAAMSFFFRFEARDVYQLELKTATARKYLAAAGVVSSRMAYLQKQLQNWRCSLPFAQEPDGNKHLIAFTRLAFREAQS